MTFRTIIELRRSPLAQDLELARNFLREMHVRLYGAGRCEACQKSVGDMSDPSVWQPHRHEDPLRDRGGPWGDYEVLCNECLAVVASPDRPSGDPPDGRDDPTHEGS